MATKEKPLPSTEQKKKPLPKVGKPENTVKIGDEMIEIKDTYLRYQRNRVIAFYKMIEMYPLPDLLAMTKEAIGEDERDGDKCLMDWLIAVFTSKERPEAEAEKLVTENYDDMTTETIETILAIFKRVNMIDKKEEALKKLK